MYRGDMRSEFAMVHTRNHVRVAEHVLELFVDIAVIQVDRHRPDLEAGQHSLEVLVTVVQVQADLVADADAPRREKMRQPVRTLLEIRVTQASLATNQRLALAYRIRDQLEHIRDIEVRSRHGQFLQNTDNGLGRISETGGASK